MFSHLVIDVLFASLVGVGIVSQSKRKPSSSKTNHAELKPEEALRESEERYRRLVEMSPDAIAIHADGIFVYVNPAAVKLIGAPNAEALLGTKVLEIVHPDSRGVVIERIQEMQKDGNPQPPLEEKFIRSDGRVIDVEVTAIPFEYQGKRAIQVIVRDITERKETNAIVREWRERYEKVLSVTGEIVYEWDIENDRTFWSSTVQQILGYSPEGMNHNQPSWEELLHPDDKDEILTKVHEALLIKSSAEILYRLRRSDGEYRYVLDRSFITRNDKGIAIRSFGSLSDITHRLRVEQVLLENEQRYKTLFEFSPTGLMLQDAQGTIVNVNDALASITGFSRRELIGKNVEILTTLEEKRHVKEHIREILSGKVLVHQVRNKAKDGSERVVELRERKITLPDGADGVLVAAHDVTERLHREQERKNQFERLQAIYALMVAVNRADELETIYQEALRALTRTLGVERSSILLFDEVGVLRFKAWQGLSDWYRKQVEGHSPWKPGEQEPLPFLVPDVVNEPSLAVYHAAFEKEKIRSVGFIPLVYQNRLLGKFMVYFGKPHTFTESEIQLMLTIAGHVAYAIERKRAEHKIIESEVRYRTLAEAAHDAIFIINRDDEIEYANSFAASMFSVSIEEMVGKKRSAFFPPEIARRQKQVVDHIFQTGIPVQAENSFPVNGRIAWHDTFLVPIKNEDGHIVSVLGISRNITERKYTEDALRKSSEQQGLVLRSLPMVFYTTQTLENMPTTWISEQVKEITGFPPKEFIQDPLFWQSRIHPEDRQRAVKEYQSVLAEGSVRTEYRWKCADGTYHWFADQTVLIKGNDGSPKEIIGIWLDINSQKMAEEALRESEAKWRTLMENSPGLVHMIDRSGTILYINRATVGYERDKVIGSTIYDYVAPETAEIMRKHVETVFIEKHSVWFEVPAAGPYGSEAWYACSIGPIVKDGTVVSAIMDSIDITEHKWRERVQAAVYRIAQVADRSQTLDELFKAVHDIIQEIMKANNFYIALYDDRNDLLSFPYFVDEIDTPSPPGPPGKGMTAYVLRTGKPLLCGIERFNELVKEGEIELVGVPSPVWLGVPLSVEKKTIGVMAVQDYHDEVAYGEQEFQVLEYISSQIAMAIRRKQAVEELRKSEEQFRLLFEESKDCIYITSAEGKILDINPSGVELFGYASKEELTKVNVSTDLYWDPNLREEESRLVRRQGYVQDFELELKRKDGTKLIVLDTATTVRDERGTITGFRGIMRDMTERKKAEEALRRSETKLREIVEHSTNLFYSHTPDHILTYVSPQTRAFFDCEPEEALIKWTELATDHPINAIGLDATERAITTGARQEPYRLELAGKKGRKIWVEANESPVVVDGKTVAVVGSLTDITERIKAEEEITKLRKAVETSGEVIFITDKAGIITFINPEFTRLYGYTENEIVGKQTPRVLKSGLVRDEEYKNFWATLISRQPIKKEFHNKSKAGKNIVVEASISPILDEMGNLEGYLAIQLDITEKKKLEEQFLRTQRLESLGTLAGGVAHDLNNVLAPILLSIEVLKRYATTEHAKKILNTIQMSADRGKQIIRQILSFARGTEGERGTIQLRHLLKEMEQIVRETFPRSIEVHSNTEKELWSIVGDPTQLHQVLLNLCVNARDAMPNGGTLELKAENITIDEHFAKMQYGAKVGPYVLLTVSDTGTGIPKDVLPRIFDPFFTTKTQGAGTGLGLSTVHAIVKGHQGFIDVYTHLDKGTTFKVFLPAQETTVVQEKHQTPVDYPTGKGEWILVVDDEASVRDITRYTLEMHGYNVLTANDGSKALAIYKERKDQIAVVLTDMMMPVMDGAETIMELRKINPNVKIISSSGLASGIQSSSPGSQHEAQAFLAKPYTAESLLTTLHKVLTQENIEKE